MPGERERGGGKERMSREENEEQMRFYLSISIRVMAGTS